MRYARIRNYREGFARLLKPWEKSIEGRARARPHFDRALLRWCAGGLKAGRRCQPAPAHLGQLGLCAVGDVEPVAGEPLHRPPPLARPLPATEGAAAHMLLLQLYPRMTAAEQDEMVKGAG